jgi:hypothetical protein
VILKDADIPFALGGGYAAWARGGPEPEHDVDFMLPEEDIERALHRLTQAGLRAEDPPEDWLVKVFDGEEMVDLIHHPTGRPVTRAMIEQADEIDVDSVVMPVLSATEILVTKLLALTEHYCDYAKLLPAARALREQVDWSAVRRETADSAFAEAFLVLADRLGITGAAGA